MTGVLSGRVAVVTGASRGNGGRAIAVPADVTDADAVGTPHTCASLSAAPARALLVITPAGFERYFDRIAARLTGNEPPPEASKPIPEVITVGPPLGEGQA